MEEAHAEASRQLATFMEERAQADLEILRQIVETNRADSGFGGLSEAERREYIMNVLMTKVSYSFADEMAHFTNLLGFYSMSS